MNLLARYDFEEKSIIEIIESENVAINMGKECIKRKFVDDDSFAMKMSSLGINTKSRLFIDTEFLFYTFCLKNDYLHANQCALLESVKKYKIDILKEFIKNFLEQLTLSELEHFENLAKYFVSYLGETYGKKSHKFFSEMSPQIEKKYCDWINRCKIIQYFGNDERSRFWKQYQFEKVEHCSKSESVIMKFKEYYAIEFLGETMGPIYIYGCDTFEREIYKWFNWYYCSELKNVLYHNSFLYIYRKEHRGYWQHDVNLYLTNKGIITKI